MAVSVDDIAAELGRPVPDSGSTEFEQWTRWIAQALLLIKTRFGSLNDLDPDVLDYVVTQAVAAHVRRPDDSLQVDVAVDDGRVSKRYESSSGRVTILPEWWGMLSPKGGKGKAFSIDTASGAGATTWGDRPDLHMQWVWPRTDMADPIPGALE